MRPKHKIQQTDEDRLHNADDKYNWPINTVSIKSLSFKSIGLIIREKQLITK